MVSTRSKSFESLAGALAFATGVLGLVYSVAFVFLYVRGAAPRLGLLLSSLALMAGGILTSAVLVAVYDALREVEERVALWALILGLAAAIGSTVHGGFDLANVLHPPTTLPSDVPSEIDPRGLLTFGLAGLSLLPVAWLMRRSARFSRNLGSFAYFTAALLLLVYFGRLVVLVPTRPIVLLPSALLGFIVSPAWYFWLGVQLRKTSRQR